MQFCPYRLGMYDYSSGSSLTALRWSVVEAGSRDVRELYFDPKYEEFRPRTIWSLSEAFTSAFQELDPTREAANSS